MILTIDIGNSNIVSILYDKEGQKLFRDRTETIKLPDYHDYCDFLKELLEKMGNLRPSVISISCVVPPIKSVIEKVIHDLLPKVTCYFVSLEMVPNLKVHLDNPREIGADLIATSYGAYASYKQPSIIADLGSATKITLVNEGELFLGGILMPGMDFMAKGLHRMIPHLPHIDLEKPEMLLGSNTIQCIQSGIINGTLAAVKEMARGVEEELNLECTWIMTGGLSNLFTEEEIAPYVKDDDLLSDGIYHLTRDFMKREEE